MANEHNSRKQEVLVANINRTIIEKTTQTCTEAFYERPYSFLIFLPPFFSAVVIGLLILVAFGCSGFVFAVCVLATQAFGLTVVCLPFVFVAIVVMLWIACFIFVTLVTIRCVNTTIQCSIRVGRRVVNFTRKCVPMIHAVYLEIVRIWSIITYIICLPSSLANRVRCMVMDTVTFFRLLHHTVMIHGVTDAARMILSGANERTTRTSGSGLVHDPPRLVYENNDQRTAEW